MDIIRMRCPRCGSHLRVPAKKAGHHGRCPTCGGKITVLGEEAIEHVEAARVGHTLAVTVGVVVVLAGLFLGGFLLIFRGVEQDLSSTNEPAANGNGSALDRRKRINARLIQLEAMMQDLDKYQALAFQEMLLRARDVRERLSCYEPVSVYECNLRNQAMDQAEKAPSDWRPNQALTALEKDALVQLSKRLEQESQTLRRRLHDLRVYPSIDPDPLGRRMLRVNEVRELIARERERLREILSDTRG